MRRICRCSRHRRRTATGADRARRRLAFSHDHGRLADRRVHGPAGLLRLPPGLHRRAPCRWPGSPSVRSSGRGWRRWCSAGLALALRAAVRAVGRAAGGGRPGQRARGSRCALSVRAAHTGPANRRRRARGGPDGVRGAGHRLDHRRGCASDVVLATAADRHPAIGDPQRARPRAAALRADPRCARPLRSPAVGARPGRQRGRADPPDPFQRGGARGAATASCACSGRPAGWGSRAAAGSRPPGWWSPMPTSSPGRATPRSRWAASGPGCPAEPIGFDVHDDVAVLRVRGLGLPPLRLAPNPPTGDGGGDPRLSARRPFDAEPGRIGQTEVVSTENAYGQGHVQRSITALRGRSGLATRAARWSTPTAGWSHHLRGAHRHRAAGGFAVPERGRARAAGQARRRAVGDGPLRRLTSAG